MANPSTTDMAYTMLVEHALAERDRRYYVVWWYVYSGIISVKIEAHIYILSRNSLLFIFYLARFYEIVRNISGIWAVYNMA